MSGCGRLFQTAARAKCLATDSTTGFLRNRVLHGFPAARGHATAKAASRGEKGKGAATDKEERKGPEVCTDPGRLASYAVGVNIFKQGEEPELKPPGEYPAWLLQVDLGPPKRRQELEQDDRTYWKVLRKENMWRFNRLHKGSEEGEHAEIQQTT